MAKREQFITDEQWAKIEPLLPKRKVSKLGGRPPASDRECLEGILWVLRSGARWKDLPDWYPSYATCWRRLVYWEGENVLVEIWHAFLDELDEKGLINWEHIFVDASFSPAKKGATTWARPNVEKVQSGWWWLMAKEFHLHAGPRLVEQLRSKWRRQSSPKSKAPRTSRSRSSRTEPTTAMRFEEKFVRTASNSAARIEEGEKGRRRKTDES
ncbi:transposase [bacterium]|nr:transposase [bacterium]